MRMLSASICRPSDEEFGDAGESTGPIDLSRRVWNNAFTQSINNANIFVYIVNEKTRLTRSIQRAQTFDQYSELRIGLIWIFRSQKCITPHFLICWMAISDRCSSENKPPTRPDLCISASLIWLNRLISTVCSSGLINLILDSERWNWMMKRWIC